MTVPKPVLGAEGACEHCRHPIVLVSVTAPDGAQTEEWAHGPYAPNGFDDTTHSRACLLCEDEPCEQATPATANASGSPAAGDASAHQQVQATNGGEALTEDSRETHAGLTESPTGTTGSRGHPKRRTRLPAAQREPHEGLTKDSRETHAGLTESPTESVGRSGRSSGMERRARASPLAVSEIQASILCALRDGPFSSPSILRSHVESQGIPTTVENVRYHLMSLKKRSIVKSEGGGNQCRYVLTGHGSAVLNAYVESYGQPGGAPRGSREDSRVSPRTPRASVSDGPRASEPRRVPLVRAHNMRAKAAISRPIHPDGDVVRKVLLDYVGFKEHASQAAKMNWPMLFKKMDGPEGNLPTLLVEVKQTTVSWILASTAPMYYPSAEFARSVFAQMVNESRHRLMEACSAAVAQLAGTGSHASILIGTPLIDFEITQEEYAVSHPVGDVLAEGRVRYRDPGWSEADGSEGPEIDATKGDGEGGTAARADRLAESAKVLNLDPVRAKEFVRHIMRSDTPLREFQEALRLGETRDLVMESRTMTHVAVAVLVEDLLERKEKAAREAGMSPEEIDRVADALAAKMKGRVVATHDYRPEVA